MLAVAVPRSALFDVLLIVHVLVGLASLVVLGAMYGALAGLSKPSAGERWPSGPARFFAPGHEIGGRVLYLIPVTGFALLGASQGDSSLHDSFVQIGLGLWVVAALIAEIWVFSATQRLRRLISTDEVVPADDAWRRLVGQARWAIDGVLLAIVAGAVVMLVQP